MAALLPGCRMALHRGSSQARGGKGEESTIRAGSASGTAGIHMSKKNDMQPSAHTHTYPLSNRVRVSQRGHSSRQLQTKNHLTHDMSDTDEGKLVTRHLSAERPSGLLSPGHLSAA